MCLIIKQMSTLKFLLALKIFLLTCQLSLQAEFDGQEFFINVGISFQGNYSTVPDSNSVSIELSADFLELLLITYETYKFYVQKMLPKANSQRTTLTQQLRLPLQPTQLTSYGYLVCVLHSASLV